MLLLLLLLQPAWAIEGKYPIIDHVSRQEDASSRLVVFARLLGAGAGSRGAGGSRGEKGGLKLGALAPRVGDN